LLDPLTAARYAGQGLAVRPFVPSITQKITLVLPRDHLDTVIFFHSAKLFDENPTDHFRTHILRGVLIKQFCSDNALPTTLSHALCS
jgi:hypothetical protein